MSKVQGTFRYNGHELQLIKSWSREANPQKAVEVFIEHAIKQLKDPNKQLLLLRSGFLKPKKEDING